MISWVLWTVMFQVGYVIIFHRCNCAIVHGDPLSGRALCCHNNLALVWCVGFWREKQVPVIVLPCSPGEHMLPNNSETQAELQTKPEPWTQPENNNISGNNEINHRRKWVCSVGEAVNEGPRLIHSKCHRWKESNRPISSLDIEDG